MADYTRLAQEAIASDNRIDANRLRHLLTCWSLKDSWAQVMGGDSTRFLIWDRGPVTDKTKILLEIGEPPKGDIWDTVRKKEIEISVSNEPLEMKAHKEAKGAGWRNEVIALIIHARTGVVYCDDREYKDIGDMTITSDWSVIMSVVTQTRGLPLASRRKAFEKSVGLVDQVKTLSKSTAEIYPLREGKPKKVVYGRFEVSEKPAKDLGCDYLLQGMYRTTRTTAEERECALATCAVGMGIYRVRDKWMRAGKLTKMEHKEPKLVDLSKGAATPDLCDELVRLIAGSMTKIGEMRHSDNWSILPVFCREGKTRPHPSRTHILVMIAHDGGCKHTVSRGIAVHKMTVPPGPLQELAYANPMVNYAICYVNVDWDQKLVCTEELTFEKSERAGNLTPGVNLLMLLQLNPDGTHSTMASLCDKLKASSQDPGGCWTTELVSEIIKSEPEARTRVGRTCARYFRNWSAYMTKGVGFAVSVKGEIK